MPVMPEIVGRYPVAAPGQWVVAPGGYRGYLADMLNSDGVAFDYVGSRYKCGNHEGWGGGRNPPPPGSLQEFWEPGVRHVMRSRRRAGLSRRSAPP